MPRIVISYRRQDSDGVAGRIRDRLAGRYSADTVFMDVDSIPFGVDFRAYVAETLANTDVVLAIIGPKWAGGAKKQKARIQNPTDPVRIEIETALALKIPIIPVLVNGAVMPESDQLPDALKELSFRNAASVDAGRDFHPHMDRLIRSVDHMLTNSATRASGTTSGKPQPVVSAAPAGSARAVDDPRPHADAKSSGFRNRRVAVLAALGGSIALLAAGAFVLYRTPERSSAPPASTQLVSAAQPAPVSCAEEGNLRSLATSTPTSITFTNRGDKPIRLYWISHQGKRVLYATLDRSQVVSFQTYMTHPWVITNTADECQAIYMPAPHRQDISVAI